MNATADRSAGDRIESGRDGGREIERTSAPVNVSPVVPRPRPGPLVAGLFCSDADRDWDWEGYRAGGKLHLYCYLRDTVVALAPFEFEG